MRGNYPIALALFASLLAAAPVMAAEGVLLATQITNGTNVTKTEVQIEPNRMRTVITTGTESQVIIFDGTKQVLFIVNHARKSYMQMTKADLDQMAGMLQAMAAQMANLPPAARAQMEGMMRGRGMGGPTERTVYQRAGTDRVGKWTCDKYEGYRAKQKVVERCTASPASLGFTAADFAVTQQLAEFARGVIPQAADQLSILGQAETDGFSGLPLRSVSYSATGTVTTTTEVTGATRAVFEDALFAIPAGYTRQQMMGGRGQ